MRLIEDRCGRHRIELCCPHGRGTWHWGECQVLEYCEYYVVPLHELMPTLWIFVLPACPGRGGRSQCAFTHQDSWSSRAKATAVTPYRQMLAAPHQIVRGTATGKPLRRRFQPSGLHRTTVIVLFEPWLRRGDDCQRPVRTIALSDFQQFDLSVPAPTPKRMKC